MTRFEDRLLAELRALVGTDRPADAEPAVPARQPPAGPSTAPPQVPHPRVKPRDPGRVRPRDPTRGRRARPRRRAAAGVIAAVLAAVGVVAGAVAWPHRLAVPAYAVDRNPDGSFLVTVNDLSVPTSLQQALLTDGVPVTVLALSAGRHCAQRPPTVAAPGVLVPRPDRPNALTIQPALLPPGDSVVLGVGGVPGQVVLVGMVVRGAAPACLSGVVTAPG
jgi:hypothetical protein